MSAVFEENLAKLGITMPTPTAPVANYVPYVVSGNMVYVSGQLPMADGKLALTGIVGDSVTAEQASEGARLCAINLIAQLKAALGGDLSRLRRVVKLGAFVASTPDFTGQPGVVNGASDLMVEVFGDAGRHARSAVATPCLPLNAAVEIDAVFEVAPE